MVSKLLYELSFLFLSDPFQKFSSNEQLHLKVFFYISKKKMKVFRIWRTFTKSTGSRRPFEGLLSIEDLDLVTLKNDSCLYKSLQNVSVFHCFFSDYKLSKTQVQVIMTTVACPKTFWPQNFCCYSFLFFIPTCPD